MLGNVPVSLMFEQQQRVRKITLDQLGSNFIFPFSMKDNFFFFLQNQNVLFLKKQKTPQIFN